MIALTGATGFLGSHLAEQLTQQNFSIKCLVRNHSPRSHRLQRISSPVVVVDFNSSTDLDKAFRGCDTFIHSLGIINASDAVLHKTNVEFTQNLIASAKRQRVRRVIFISSVAAGMRHGAYGQSKFEAEKLVLASGIPCVIFRPAFIYGKGDQNNTGLMMKTLKRFPVIPLLGGGAFKIQPVYVKDVCSLIIEALERPELTGTYTVAGPEQISLKDILKILADSMKVKRIFIPIPLKPVQAALRVYLKAFKNTRLPAKQILELDKHEAFDISDTQKVFSFRPISFAAGVPKMFSESSCAAS